MERIRGIGGIRGVRAYDVLLLALASLLAGCGRGAAKTAPRAVPVYATPADVFEAARVAGAANDHAKLYDCYSRQSQRHLAANLMQPVLVATLAKTEPKFIEPAWKVLEAHGILRKDLEETARDRKKDRPKPLDAVKDFHPLILELEAVLPEPDVKRTPHPFYYDALKDVTIRDDVATGLAHMKGKEDAAPEVSHSPLYFVKEDRGWRIDYYRADLAVKKLLK